MARSSDANRALLATWRARAEHGIEPPDNCRPYTSAERTRVVMALVAMFGFDRARRYMDTWFSDWSEWQDFRFCYMRDTYTRDADGIYRSEIKCPV